MVEIKYDDQFKRHIEEYEDRYKYVYAVEDIEPTKKEKRDVLIRKDIISVPEKPQKEVELKKKRPIKITPTPVKKPIKEKIKLFSSIILSENPIKITPAEKLEYVKKAPVKRPSIKKKKSIVKKKPISKKVSVKKSPILKKKPTKKPSVKRPSIKKKKPIVKKKITVKKKPLSKKKPSPKGKTMRAKKRNSPITGRWTARYRMIGGTRKKVKIRRWKGKIQTRIIK